MSEGVGATLFFVGGAVMIAIAGLVSMGMLHSLVNCGRGILFGAYGLFAAIWGFFALGLALARSGAAILPAGMCALIVFLLYRRRHRIQFGAANLKVGGWVVFLIVDPPPP